MSNFLPLPPAGIRPGVFATPSMAVDPAALASVPSGLARGAQLLRSGAPALFSSWDQAASALAQQRAGAVLAAVRPGTSAALEAGAAAVEALASSLRWSAMAYAGAEAAAGGRAQAWMR